ncbi:serine threonine protein kinase CMGC group [Kalmusia sp. IMI 367209]|nr:serine threonine protein kinase CMGC group [Kalmusia sp. IMI 367209]
MSTPSTATATLPPHHQFYSHHQTYQPAIANGQLTNGTGRIGNSLYNGYPNGTSNSDLRRAAVAAQRQTQQLPPIAPDMSDGATHASKRRGPDWNEFYRNGLPKEVIVIDDDDDDDEPARPPLPAPPSRTTTNGSTRHTDKKRKTTASTAYDPVYNQHTSYSTTQTPYYDSPGHSTPADRTASAHKTTAGTSIGSSNGHHISPLDNTMVGQKRKRTRAAVQDEAKEAKRRELDDQDPFALYQPPPEPGYQGQGSIRDPYTRLDDEDGHYVVHPEADLTERYQILKLLGQGTFGKVVEAWDKIKRTKCAIKVIRSVPKYRGSLSHRTEGVVNTEIQRPV